MAAWGGKTVSMGPFRVALSGGFGRGVTDIALPPLGHLTADSHRAPLHFTATLKDVDIPRLTDELQSEGTEGVAGQVERDALDQLWAFAFRLFQAGMVGALGLALIAFRRNIRAVGIALASALIAIGGSEAAAFASFRPVAFLSPTYSGSLALAPKLIGPVRSATHRIDDFRAELQQVVESASRVYTSTANGLGDEKGEVRILHISDIHLSPLGFQFAQQVARSFDVDFVIDTGDLTSFGTPAEELVLSFIPGFDRPYVFVRGNHDSRDLQLAMEEVPNAVVLDGTTTRIAGVTVYGLGDPAFTPNKLTALDDKEVAALAEGAGPALAADLDRMTHSPDIVAVHDDRMAQVAAGRVPVVVAGHFHVASARLLQGSLFLRVGSTGGSGATVFTQAHGVPFSAEILYYRAGTPAGTPPILVAYDLIEQDPLTGSLTVRRHLISEEFGALAPSPLPSPTETLTPSEASPALPASSLP
jgi:predicted MPP superfamily phosphohydrolase